MAVVQISRIQVRRGQANSGTGLPQLASGEIAWAVDTQELFIGNGSVAEGAPAVGNTKILTQHDNLFDVFNYQYKTTDPAIQTGALPNFPVVISLQERLDQVVFARQFGAMGDVVPVYNETGDLLGYEGTDDTDAIQNALTQLFNNTGHTDMYSGIIETQARGILYFEPGIYKITDTITIPSYTTIIGAGVDKTIFMFEGTTGPAFKIGDNSLTATNQPKYINLEGFSVTTTSQEMQGFEIKAMRDSSFKDVSVTGSWTGGSQDLSRGIDLTGVTTLIDCSRNTFENISVSKFQYGIYADNDVIDNKFVNCALTEVKIGFALGENGSAEPTYNSILECRFNNVKESAVVITKGHSNKVISCSFTNVGNDGAGVSSPLYPQVSFLSAGNTLATPNSDRDIALGSSNLTTPFRAIASGIVSHEPGATYQINIAQHVSSTVAFRVPATTNGTSYAIKYVYRSTSFDIVRRGTLTIIADIDNNNVEWSDDYDVAAAAGIDTSALNFTVSLDQLGVGVSPDTITVSYTNTLNGDNSKLTYSYSLISTS